VLGVILQETLKSVGVVPAQNDKELQVALSNLEEPEEKILLHDATEREIPRPVDEDLQKENYSGKKKKHTVKNTVIATACCLILYVSVSFSGKTHDKRIADENYTIPEGFTLYQDTGYQGYRPEGVTVIQPMKKPPGKELTKEQKENNRRISSERVRIEHVIGSAKRCRIVKDEPQPCNGQARRRQCRLRKNNFTDNIFRYCAALHNFRIKHRPFKYKSICNVVSMSFT
jgi:hypothetical protein